MNKVIKNFQNISYGPAPEDSNEVNSWVKNLKNPNNLFINGKFELRTMLPLSLSYDHRIIDGAEAARFNNELKENLGKNFAYKLAI